jgi:hypothetical protein
MLQTIYLTDSMDNTALFLFNSVGNFKLESLVNFIKIF